MQQQPTLIDVPVNPAPTYPTGFYKGKPRPQRDAQEVMLAAVNKLLPEVMQWGDFKEAEAPEVAQELLSAFAIEDHDGYRLARQLERAAGWDSNSELSEILEGADFHGCHEIAVQAWIKDNDITPLFAVGQQVVVKKREKNETLTGIIRSTTKNGMYCVMVPSEGHVESGFGTHGFLLPWETIEEWNNAESTQTKG